MSLGQGQLGDSHHQRRGAGCRPCRSLHLRQQGGQCLGEIEASLPLAVRETNQVQAGGGQGRLRQHQGALSPALFHLGNEAQPLERHQHPLLVVEQGGGAQGEGG